MPTSFGTYAGSFVQIVVGAYTSNWSLVASGVAGIYGTARQETRAKRKAIQAINDAAKDRFEMLDLQPDQARTLVLGRVRYVEGVRKRWTSGTHSETLTMIVSLAGHRIDGIEQWYLDDQPVTLDADGWVNEAPYRTDSNVPASVGIVLDGAGAGSVDIRVTPIGTIHAVWWTGSGETMVQGELTPSLIGTVVSVAGGPPGASCSITWSDGAVRKTVRIRPYLGLSTQNVGADIAAEYPGEITSDDAFAGIALAVIDYKFDQDAMPQGRPTPTALMRGALCYDPRKDSTVSGGSGTHRADDENTWEWSERPALCALRYATWQPGWNLDPAADVVMRDFMDAADACTVSTVFTLRMPDDSTTTVTLPRYSCGIAIASDADHQESMDSIIETMAGAAGWFGGQWRVRAGALRSTAFTIDSTWFVSPNSGGRPSAGPVISGVQSLRRDQRINLVTGKCVDPDQRYQLLPFPAYPDETLIAAQGERRAEVEYQGVVHIAQAQHLASIAIRTAQAGLHIEAQCGIAALDAELFDVAELDLPRFGMADKTMEVIGDTWSPNSATTLLLREITAAMFTPVTELKGRDPAPDSTLRPPWEIEDLTGLAVSGGGAGLTDNGSIITRTLVEWDAAVGETIRNGGGVEIQYTEASAGLPDGDWPEWPEAGSASSTVIPGLLSGRYYYVRGRFVQKMPLVRGLWSEIVRVLIGGPRTVATGGIAAGAVTGELKRITTLTGSTSDFIPAGLTMLLVDPVSYTPDVNCSVDVLVVVSVGDLGGWTNPPRVQVAAVPQSATYVPTKLSGVALAPGYLPSTYSVYCNDSGGDLIGSSPVSWSSYVGPEVRYPNNDTTGTHYTLAYTLSLTAGTAYRIGACFRTFAGDSQLFALSQSSVVRKR